MKILFVTYDIPYPLDAGGKIRAYHLIKKLSGRHRITLFSYYREKSQLKHLSHLEKYCQKIRLFQRMNVFSLKHILTTLLHPNLTAHISHYYHRKLHDELESELKSNSYNILHLESFFTSHLLGKYPVRQVLGTENIEWRVFFEHAKRQKLPLVREAMVLESFRTRLFEENTFRKADICLAVSKKNAQEIERITKKKCYIVPNGVDLEHFKLKKTRKSRKILATLGSRGRQRNKETRILFVGNFKYIQNQDAVLVLVKEIFPLIKKEIKNAKLLIVGRDPIREIKNLADKDILVENQVEDIRDAYLQADVLLAPIRAGSGTKFKILEAMASGVPVVTTKVGGEGIEAQEGKEILIRETPEKIAKAAVELIENKDLRHRLIINARKLVEEKYDWKKIVAKLEKIYGIINNYCQF